ncbi:MAG: GNAT family N-acetyltransferase [Mycobacterium sp.]
MSAVSASDLAALPLFAEISARDLATLAAGLEPMRAAAGEVLTRQGEQAESFAVIASGAVQIQHVGPDGEVATVELAAGMVVGEIALLRRSPRTATVIATDAVLGYRGGTAAFDRMLAIPAVADRMLRTARQRLATFLTPIPVQTSDGAELLLRPVLPGDAERFTGSGSFSRETLYRRYQGATPSAAGLVYLFEVDYVDHFVWVAVAGPDGPVVADARFIRDRDDPASAEVALTVADAYQGRGIGTLLLDALAVAARVDGVGRFHARVLAENPGARALGDKMDLQWERDEPGVVTTSWEVPEAGDLSVPQGVRRQIERVAHQVIHAFG